MKKSVLLLVLFIAAYSLQAQKSIEGVPGFDEVVDELSNVNCDRMTKKEQKLKVSQILADYIAENPNDIERIRAQTVEDEVKVVSKEKVMKYIDLQKQAHKLVHPDKEVAKSRGGAQSPTDAAWDSYYRWYTQDRSRVNLLPGHVVVTADYLSRYQADTRCYDSRTCMTKDFLWHTKTIADAEVDAADR